MGRHQYSEGRDGLVNLPYCLLWNQLLFLFEMLRITKAKESPSFPSLTPLTPTFIIRDKSPASANSSTMFSCRERGREGR